MPPLIFRERLRKHDERRQVQLGEFLSVFTCVVASMINFEKVPEYFYSSVQIQSKLLQIGSEKRRKEIKKTF